MPNLSVLKTFPKKLLAFLLTDKPIFLKGLFIFTVLFFPSVWFFHQWAMYFVPASILLLYIFCGFRVFVWLRNARRRLPAFIQGMKGMGPPETEAENATKAMKLRTLWLVMGLVLLATSISVDPMLVSFAFSIGLLAAFLVCGCDRHDEVNAMPRKIEIGRFIFSGLRPKIHPREVGARVFVVVMTGYVFYFLNSNEALLGWGAGYICGFASFNDNWSSGIRGWADFKKNTLNEISGLITIKKHPGKKD